MAPALAEALPLIGWTDLIPWLAVFPGREHPLAWEQGSPGAGLVGLRGPFIRFICLYLVCFCLVSWHSVWDLESSSPWKVGMVQYLLFNSGSEFVALLAPPFEHVMNWHHIQVDAVVTPAKM
jgi:hypothetical protein